MSKEKNEVGFISHLTELRQRLVHSLVFLAALFIVFFAIVAWFIFNIKALEKTD